MQPDKKNFREDDLEKFDRAAPDSPLDFACTRVNGIFRDSGSFSSGRSLSAFS